MMLPSPPAIVALTSLRITIVYNASCEMVVDDVAAILVSEFLDCT